MRKSSGKSLLGNLILLLLSCILTISGVEVVLRTFLPEDRYVLPPNFKSILNPSPEIMPGVAGVSTFSINSSGIRGDEFSDDQAYRVLAVGGSTTVCSYLDDLEAWPYLLQGLLNKKSGFKVWVGNIGRSGLNTRHHIVQLDKLLAQYPRIDAVILLVGINDFVSRLKREKDYDGTSYLLPEDRYEVDTAAFFIGPDPPDWPFYKRTQIWKRLRQIKQNFSILSDYIEDPKGNIYLKWRSHRQSAPLFRDTLPNLSSALTEYSNNLNRIIDITKERGVRVILVTQPFLWRRNLPQELRRLLWMGGIGDYQHQSGNEYYSVEALASGMGMYNETLLTVCRNRRIECIDLESSLPKDTTVFYDDVHFNVSGSRKVAEIVSNYLLGTSPFEQITVSALEILKSFRGPLERVYDVIT